MKKYFGDRAFYRMLLCLVLPIIAQQGITNFVNLLDNVMVGKLGTEPMSGVAIVNQLMFVFNLSLFGAMAGAGIFGAQFCGKGDDDGVRQCFRFKLLCVLFLVVTASAVLFFGREHLIGLYLKDEGEQVGDIAMAYRYAEQYLFMVLPVMRPTGIAQMYASTLKEHGKTLPGMLAGLIAVAVNLLGNYLLIFGTSVIPALGVRGAALATVLARLVEMTILIVYTHSHAVAFPFIKGAYRTLRIRAELFGSLLRTGLPLLCNEFFWSTAVTTLAQCYATRGLIAVAAYNITSTANNLFLICGLSMGEATGLICGRLLGAGEREAARDSNRKLLMSSLLMNLIFMIIILLIAPTIPRMYNTQESVRLLATRMLRVAACCIPVQAVSNACYFTLRCGGKTWVTFLFDSVFMWCVTVVVVWLLSRHTAMGALLLFGAAQLLELIKVFIGLAFVKSGTWMNVLVKDDPA